ncbi:MmgE/PrpD family protein [Pontibacillus marinus]|uniref:2-methylcitrate dehydratase n=1 Tax=Pontibacillus marinus BH030004 = DSM 16465 TaxID=1385511 RepID=A0A0A5HV20_9BACI|nr:MmgE/PrpD family protein [Pontibacillus marinus]KGX87467.1 hypothetical protein N783_09820 [Pontibacillus marinus BH030004 = DSM 16465]
MKFITQLQDRLHEYILEESITTIPEEVMESLKDALADIVASSIAGSNTPVVEHAKRFAQSQWKEGASSILLTSGQLSATGASFVNATMANALDIDDGHRLVKGHPGAVLFPAILAVGEEKQITGEEFLSTLLMSYEVGIRAGIIAHELRPEYHCTGSWGAIGAAAGVSRILNLSVDKIYHALGVAEYHSTYSPMLRGIDHPSMLKDGISWGCMTGVSSAILAQEGFTGIPSLFNTENSRGLINDLKQRYRIEELYYKPYACCRWAQPPIEAIKELMEKNKILYKDVNSVKVYTFKEAASLSKKPPNNTEEAQYNLPYPMACYFVFQNVGPNEVTKKLSNQDVVDLMKKVEVYVDEELDKEFPKKALCWIEVYMNDGKVHSSAVQQAQGDWDYPLSKVDKQEKFYRLVVPHLGQERSNELYKMIHSIEQLLNIKELTRLINFPFYKP